MIRKYLIISVFSLLVFFLSVYTYVENKKPIPPSRFENRVLFFSYLPHYLNALYWFGQFKETPLDYYLTKTLEEIENALLIQPTEGFLWLWDAKVRKFLGMRYKVFAETALWIDPYRIDHNEVLSLLSPEEITSTSTIYGVSLLDKLVLLNRNWNFFNTLFKKIWQRKYGKNFLLRWLPPTNWGKEYLAAFLILHNHYDRGITILKNLKDEKINWRPLWALTKIAEKRIREGKRDLAEKLLLTVYELQPHFDNIGVRIFNFYYRGGKREKAMKFYRMYITKFRDYVTARRLKKYVEGLNQR